MISKDVYAAAQLLYNNEIIAIPTETVYGLAGNIFEEKAIKRIYSLKNRPLSNPLIVHIGSRDEVFQLAAEVPELAKKLMDKFWPGPLTLLLKKDKSVPEYITAGKDTVALRMPNHPDVLKLLHLLPFPLAAPSANPFGSISPTSALHVADYFGEKLPLILDGGICEKGIESTIVGFENNLPVIYRLGSISLEEIQNEIGTTRLNIHNAHDPVAPGMMERHYAPETVTVISTDFNSTISANPGKRIALLRFKTKFKTEVILHQEILSVSGNLKDAASNLYAAMHRLDHLKLDLIIAEKFPDESFGRVINDRLKRASKPLNFINN